VKIYLLFEEENAGVAEHDFSKKVCMCVAERQRAENIFRRATTNQAPPRRVNNIMQTIRATTNNNVPQITARSSICVHVWLVNNYSKVCVLQEKLLYSAAKRAKFPALITRGTLFSAFGRTCNF